MKLGSDGSRFSLPSASDRAPPDLPPPGDACTLQLISCYTHLLGFPMTSTTEPGTLVEPSSTTRLSQEVSRLVRASQSMRAQVHARQPDGIEWAGYMLLFQLCKEGPQRSSALAATACVDPSTVS